MYEEEEYRVPIKILTDRDPIVAGRLSIRELVQWVFFGALIYICFHYLPLPFQFNLVLGAVIFMGAIVFIHAPVNGLSGLEWLYINFRYRLEKRLHQARGIEAGLSLAQLKPAFTVRLKLGRSTSPDQEEINPRNGLELEETGTGPYLELELEKSQEI